MFNKTIFTLMLLMVALVQSIAQIDSVSSSRCATIEKTDEQMDALPWAGNNAYLDDFHKAHPEMFIGESRVVDQSVNVQVLREGFCYLSDSGFIVKRIQKPVYLQSARYN